MELCISGKDLAGKYLIFHKMNNEIKARLRSFVFAGKGIVHVIRTQGNARIHAAATVAVILAGFLCSVSLTEWCLLLMSIGMVWTAEIFNTALERLVDLVSPEYHPLAKYAKDCAAGAVLAASLSSLLIAAIIFLPKVHFLLNTLPH